MRFARTPALMKGLLSGLAAAAIATGAQTAGARNCVKVDLGPHHVGEITQEFHYGGLQFTFSF